MGAQKKRSAQSKPPASQPKRGSAPTKRTATTGAKRAQAAPKPAIARAKGVTAQPRPLSDDIGAREPTEEGLSIDPEDMGQSFLRYATEQANYETQRGASAAELSPDDEAGTDEALDSPNFSPDASVWSNTIDIASSAGRVEDIARAAEPSTPNEPEEAWEHDADEEQRSRRGVMEIDLSESVIDEASLLDEESDVLGEVIPKEPQTEDAHHTSRPR
jgi:hypothetical protein